MEEGRSAFKILIGKYRKETFKKNNTRIDIKEIDIIDINTRNWVDSAQDMDFWRTLVNATLNFGGP